MIYVIVMMDNEGKVADINSMAFQSKEVASIYIERIKKGQHPFRILQLQLDKHTGVANGKPVVL